MAQKAKKRGLGRGLDALFADAAPVIEVTEEPKQEEEQAPAAQTEAVSDVDRIIYVDINDIKPNPDQPRKSFNASKLNDLANSIRENGVIQPLVVQKRGDHYELVAGERRWRASRIAELKKIPCIIREFDEKQNLIVAIIENMQREDLDPIEEASGLQEMIQRFEFTQEEVSNSLGKSRAYIANSVRLLKLPEDIQKMMRDGKISAAHGRTLLSISDAEVQRKLAERIEQEGLSVRQVENIAKLLKEGTPEKPERKKIVKSTEIRTVEQELRETLGTKVSIASGRKKGKGKIEIEYYSTEELNRLIDMLRTTGNN